MALHQINEKRIHFCYSYQANHGLNKERYLFNRMADGEFTHAFFITNIGDMFTPKAIVQTYQKRGMMENY
ncbi:hypothetical protein D1839_13950 [Roseburia sp. 1XD42-34]|nr:hypothetical protein [Roseburia sp. 1XD42-34]RKI76049.1 hypothetical protein D7V87_14580 [Clostridium sp. 1xD42-85]